MDTLLATVCLPRWRHDRGHRHHAAFPLPSRNCTVSHSPALAPIPERGIEKRAQGGLVRKQLRFLEVVSAATGSPWPRWLLPACGSPRPLAITIANGIRLPSTLCRWGGGKASAAFPKLALQALFEAEPQPEWPVSLRVTAIREPVSLQTRCNLSGEMQLTTCVGSESSCPVFVAHHLSASGLSNLAGSEAVDETSCWGGVTHAAAGATLSAFASQFLCST